VARAQVELATASLKKRPGHAEQAAALLRLEPPFGQQGDPRHRSKLRQGAKANLDVVSRQFELTRAGAWTYEFRIKGGRWMRSPRHGPPSTALLAKTRFARRRMVWSFRFSCLGSYVSSQVLMGTYTQGLGPSSYGHWQSSGYMSVRCYGDRILDSKLPSAEKMDGDDVDSRYDDDDPLDLSDCKPYGEPEIELSESTAREGRSARTSGHFFASNLRRAWMSIRDQMVDVYIGAQDATGSGGPSCASIEIAIVEYGGDQRATSPSTLLVNRP